MSKEFFIELVQRRIASTSIGASTARGMGPTGTVEGARDFLRRLDLRDFKKPRRASFEDALNKVATTLMAALPKGAQHWGSSRKFLNIFLRGVLYNRYLCEEYGFCKLEPWLELPLDSHVAKGLRLEEGSEVLPRWLGVIHLSPDGNQCYQQFAERVAVSKGTYRVHLDLLYWRAWRSHG